MGLIPIFSIFLISVIVITSQSGPVFAETEVIIAGGSSVPGCEETNQCFLPATVTVEVGDSVVWYNYDSAAHTVTTGTVSGGPDGFLNVFLQVNDALDARFPNSGTFDYFCMVHPWMTGKVVVKDVSSPPPKPVSPAPPPVYETPAAPKGTDIKVMSGTGVPGCEESNSCYLPYTFKADVGETVTWFNQDSAAHTVTSGSIANGGRSRYGTECGY